jgi:hypothetical protein
VVECSAWLNGVLAPFMLRNSVASGFSGHAAFRTVKHEGYRRQSGGSDTDAVPLNCFRHGSTYGGFVGVSSVAFGMWLLAAIPLSLLVAAGTEHGPRKLDVPRPVSPP